MSDEVFRVAVENLQNLHEKYNELVKMTPPTGRISFGKAREVVGEGT
jgi:hypothetical protein